jgi:hypothetical protein
MCSVTSVRQVRFAARGVLELVSRLIIGKRTHGSFVAAVLRAAASLVGQLRDYFALFLSVVVNGWKIEEDEESSSSSTEWESD